MWDNRFLDTTLPFFRETMFWIPLYIFLFVFALLNFGKRAWWWILAGVLIAAISDLIASHLIKENIWRTRPCQDNNVASQLRFFINYCPRSSSFLSSHATTHFAQATFFYITLNGITRWRWLFFLWAFVIAYTQLYVGVHYPFDVFCGIVLGCLIGWAISKVFTHQIGTLTVS